jgi:hypothetical protein
MSRQKICVTLPDALIDSLRQVAAKETIKNPRHPITYVDLIRMTVFDKFGNEDTRYKLKNSWRGGDKVDWSSVEDGSGEPVFAGDPVCEKA